MKNTYWVAKLRYGHVGTGKEVCINRYLRMKDDSNINDVIEVIKTMPGVKKGDRSYKYVRKINQQEFYKGKMNQKDNLYLKKLWSYKKHAV